jgi:hypothetical protein
MVSVHFLNVGHGDCTIIEHASGHITMVDINNSDALDDDTRRELAQAFGITGATYAAKQAVAEALGQSFRKLYLTEAGYDIGLTDGYLLQGALGRRCDLSLRSHSPPPRPHAGRGAASTGRHRNGELLGHLQLRIRARIQK